MRTLHTNLTITTRGSQTENVHSGKIATVTGSVIRAFRPYLSDKFPTIGVTTRAPSPVICMYVCICQCQTL
jgi:hypothetical protein